MYLIPAIDLMGGKCVRLLQGNYQKVTIYHHHPLELAQRFQDAGISHLHLVDLEGAKARTPVNLKVLEAIAGRTSLRIDFGGGIQTTDDLRRVFDAGASQATIGSIAVKNPDLFSQWIARHGSESIILAADVRQGKVAVSGWQETTPLAVIDFISQQVQLGVQYVLCTDIERDGTLQGVNCQLYEDILQHLPHIQLIASGGVSSLADIEALQPLKLYGVIIGKAFYEERITWQDLRQFAK
ncbi:MAG: 1-(5-phosphoribosyl)-5-[(5-phosphoribosylamino)methylideneamino]imidazole-4-carboxamide isomerase [Cytophagales bacterium]|nr:1-(5-phosphoribosyl)-5-[(5-phosphoribosylamino)methylideneamino]imidazole-4-carboxamide isomerase [Bernardetiaceae bacterium]MDW8210459.1 1-(5-phosphoribosyl)-5-[(5-phosphoribosylamino)methylideneamino]imidazole-4-carboxamide isomerase [Cytophagales bacterium]